MRQERSGYTKEFQYTASTNPHLNTQDTVVIESRTAFSLSALRPGPGASPEEAKGSELKVTHTPRQPFPGDTS